MKKRKLDYKLQTRQRSRKKLRRKISSKKLSIQAFFLLLFLSLLAYFLFKPASEKDFQHFLWIHVQAVDSQENLGKLNSVIWISYLEEAELIFLSFFQGTDSIDGQETLQEKYQKGIEELVENFSFRANLESQPYYQVVQTQFYSTAFRTLPLKVYLEDASKMESSLKGILDLSFSSKKETSFLYPIQNIDQYLFSETLPSKVQRNRIIVSLLALLNQRDRLFENKNLLKDLNSLLLSDNLSSSKIRDIQAFFKKKNPPKVYFTPVQNPENLKIFLNPIQSTWDQKETFTAEDYLSSFLDFLHSRPSSINTDSQNLEFSTRWINRSGRKMNSILLARFLKLFHLDLGTVWIEENKPPLENSQLIALKKDLPMALYLKEALQTPELYWSAESRQNDQNQLDFILVGGADFPEFD